MGPKDLTSRQKLMDAVADGAAMGVGVLIVSMGVRKIDIKIVPEQSKVSVVKIVGGCMLASAIIQLLKSYSIIPSTYGHVLYRYKIVGGVAL